MQGTRALRRRLMIKRFVAKITGVNEQTYKRLQADIIRLKGEKQKLENDLKELKTSKDLLIQKGYEARLEISPSIFLVGRSHHIGDHKDGHSIYEVRVPGVDVPIRTKIAREIREILD